MKETDFKTQRKRLVEYIGFAIKTPQLKRAFLEVRRETFVPQIHKNHSYEDNAVPIGFEQTISQPSTIAIMLELFGVKEGMKILEVGSGCGYVLALLSKIVGAQGEVFGIELEKELVKICEKNLSEEQISNVQIMQGEGSLGWAEKAPFDRIIISCACPFVPKTLFDQLKENGRIVAPIGDDSAQMLEIMIKKNGKPFKKTYHESLFTFVPMRGAKEFR